MANERSNGNLVKLALLAFLVPLLAAAVGLGVLRGNVQENSRDIRRIETSVDARLQRIEDKLDEVLMSR